jgi:hypothetical protein
MRYRFERGDPRKDKVVGNQPVGNRRAACLTGSPVAHLMPSPERSGA